jgi:hypothetical protein
MCYPVFSEGANALRVRERKTRIDEFSPLFLFWSLVKSVLKLIERADQAQIR